MRHRQYNVTVFWDMYIKVYCVISPTRVTFIITAAKNSNVGKVCSITPLINYCDKLVKTYVSI